MRLQARWRSHQDHHGEEGLTLVELLVAFAALLILMTIVATALTTYLNVGNNVIASYSATDQLLPSSTIIQRLIRSEVEPGPAPSATSATCPTTGNACPPFLTGSVGTFSTTFFANVGNANGPAKIVMASTAPVKCAGCHFYTSRFTVTQYLANAGTCPLSINPGGTCTWSANGTVLVTINGIVNGQTNLPNAATPIFTYNTLDPYSSAYTVGAGGAPNGVTGLLTNFNSCNATTLVGGLPTASNCPPDIIQSVGVDLQVQVQGAPFQENNFVVYRLSSASYLYNPLVG